MVNNDYYSTTQMCIVIIPNIFATFSILCSIFVDQDVLKLPERRVKITNGVILGLRFSDLILSTYLHFFGMWSVPRGLVYGSSGNQGGSIAQDLFIIFSFMCGAF